MLVFIDESGDPGLKVDQGSSRFFTIGLLVFEDHDEATACDARIQLLKKELGWADGDEFHFKRNSDKVRAAFLQAVASYSFFYYGIVIDKDPRNMSGDVFSNKASFYKYACGLVFENAKEKLQNAIVVVDRSGNLDFRNQLAQYLRRKVNGQRKVIKCVKMQRSESNNLLQLADYVASIISRSVADRKNNNDLFRKMIAHREMYIQVWPR